MLLFNAGEDRYACSCDAIIEILPHVHLKSYPNMPDYVAGSLDYGGKPIPVVDWCRLVQGRPCSNSLHSRIILCRFSQPGEKENMMGLMAEKVTQAMDLSLSKFADSGINTEKTPYLTGVMSDEKGSVQFVKLNTIYYTLHEEVFKS